MDGQFRWTHCQTADEHIALGATPVLRLFACAPSLPDNVLWHLDRADSKSGAFDGRTVTPATGKGVVVYVVDFSIRADHEEFMRPQGSIVIDVRNVGRVPRGCGATSTFCSLGSSHGTAVASIIGGATTGIAPDVKIVSIIAGPADYRNAMRAIVQHAYSPTAPQFRTAVINISGGYMPNYPDYAGLEEDVRRMTSGVDVDLNPDPNGKRFVFAVAAGNGPLNGMPGSCAPDGGVIAFPALFAPSIDGLLSVGAITKENEIWEGSCRGPLMEVLAPGAHVLLASGTAIDHFIQPAAWAGTSFASPYVAGMAARILEREPDLSPAEVEARLKDSASHVDGIPVPVMGPETKRGPVR